MTVLTGSDADALIQEQGLDIVIPANFTSIDNFAFFGKSLTSVVIPDSVTSISNFAFASNC